jgi:hypothetical protein
MRTLDIRGALRRRWYVLLGGALATLALAVAALVQVGPSHELRASALLLPPNVTVVSPEARESSNPFLRLDGIDPALSVLVTKLMADEFSDRMLEGAPDTDYTVAEDPLSQAPVVVVTASGKDAAEASAVLDRVTEEMPQVLDDLQAQAGITGSARITLVPLVRDEEPQRVIGGLVRIEILLLGGGLVGTLLLVGLWDAIARSRTATRSAGGQDTADEPGDEPRVAAEPAQAAATEPEPESGPAVERVVEPVARQAPTAEATPAAPAAPRVAAPAGKVSRKAKKAARAAHRTAPGTANEPPAAADDADAAGVKV